MRIYNQTGDIIVIYKINNYAANRRIVITTADDKGINDIFMHSI